jgi:hypothetical protein
LPSWCSFVALLLTAGGSIVIDKRKLQLFQKESILGEPDIDAATVQTEVEVLKSDNIGLAVVRKLHLADDPEFMAPILTAPATPIESIMDGAGTAIADRKTAPPAQDWLRYAVDSPFCRYAEAIRSVKIAADLSGALKSHKAIGVTSTLPNEGKSTIAANLAP